MNNRKDQLTAEQFEAKHNLTGFFMLLLEVADRNNIDVKQYENIRNTNNSNQGK
jgi:hypothetical protein